MSNIITYLGETPVYTGGTTNYTFTSPVNIYKGQTVVIFIQSSSIGLNPTPPTDWVFVNSVDTSKLSSGMDGTMFCYYCQPTSTLIHPSWTISGFSPNFNTGFGIFLSGVTLIQNQVINASAVEAHPSYASPITNGFSTTVRNTAIIQAVSIFKHPISTPYWVVTNGWSSTPSLTWLDVKSGNGTDEIKTHSNYGIAHGAAISVVSPKDNYTNFSYNVNNFTESLSITVALSPINSKPNTVLNGLESF